MYRDIAMLSWRYFTIFKLRYRLACTKYKKSKCREDTGSYFDYVGKHFTICRHIEKKKKVENSLKL